MPTADFSARTTNIPETPNYVSPQQGVVDQSNASLVSTAGAGALMGTETVATKKTEAFTKEYTDITEAAFGWEESSTEEEKAFIDTMKKVDQAEQLGAVRVAKMYRENYRREQAAKYPWLAKRFEDAARRVDGRYQELISGLEDLEQQKAAAAKEKSSREFTLYRNRLERLEALSTRTGYVPLNSQGEITPWESLNDSELLMNERAMQRRSQALKIEEEMREATNFRNQQQAHGWQGTQVNIAVQRYNDDLRDRAEQKLSQATLQSVYASMEQDIQRIAAGPGTEEDKRIAMVELGEMAVQKYNALAISGIGGQGGILPPSKIGEGAAQIRNTIESYNNLISGPTSTASIAKMRLQAISSQLNLSQLEAGNIIAVMNALGIDAGLYVSQAMLGAAATREGQEAQSKLIDDTLEDIGRYVNNTGVTYDSLKPVSREVLQTGAATAVVSFLTGEAATVAALQENPAQAGIWVTPAVTAYKDTTSQSERDKIYAALTNPSYIAMVPQASGLEQQRANESMKELFARRAREHGRLSEYGSMVALTSLEEGGDVQFYPKEGASQEAVAYASTLNRILDDATKFSESLGFSNDPVFVAREYLDMEDEENQ